MVVVERRGAFVVHDAPRVELWLAGLLALRQFLDAGPDGCDSATNTFLNEISGELGFLPQLVIQGLFGPALAGDTVVVVPPGPLARSVSTVEELSLGLMEIATTFSGYVEFDPYRASSRVAHL